MAAKALTLTKLDMDEALASGQIQLAYQPIFSLRDGSLARIEALVRWEHPRLGTMLPAVFLPAFEAENRLPALTRRVLERSAAEFASWALASPSGLSINLSARDLVDPSLPAAVKSVVTAVNLDPAKLTLECPVLSIGDETVRTVLRGLKDAGVKLAAEMMRQPSDVAEAFSLAPFDEIKTSGRGLLRAARNNHTSTLTGAADLISYSEGRGAIVTAIGAEDDAACQALRTVGFHQVQANVLAPALPIDAVNARMVESARRMLGFDTARQERDDPLGETTLESSSAFYQERRRAQGDMLRRAAEKRIDDEREAALLSGRGVRAVQNVLASHYGDAAESDEVRVAEPDVRAQQEALMREAESKAGLLMRTDLAAASLGYGTSPLRPAPKKPVEETRADVAEAIADVLVALPAEVDERAAGIDPLKEEPSPDDRLDAEVAKLPALDESDLVIAAGGSPVHEELLELASKLRAEPRTTKNFLQRKYKLRVTHFWPKPWKRAYLRFMENRADRTSALQNDMLEELSGQRGEENTVAMVTLGTDDAAALTVTLNDRPTPPKERAEA